MNRRCQGAEAPAAPEGKGDRAKCGSVLTDISAVPQCPSKKSQTDLMIVTNRARAWCECSS